MTTILFAFTFTTCHFPASTKKVAASLVIPIGHPGIRLLSYQSNEMERSLYQPCTYADKSSVA